jgi:soluble lytic murein transglycosylase
MPVSLRRRILRFFAILAGFTLSTFSQAADKTELERQRAQFPLVYETALKGPVDSWRRLAVGLESYPLFAYLELASVQRRPGAVRREDFDAFVKKYPNSLPTAILREGVLVDLAKRQDWKNYLALYDDSTRNRELRCDALQARIATGQKIDFAADIQPLWLTEKALPGACDAPLKWAKDQNKLTAALIWQRIDLVSRAGRADQVSALAPMLDGADRTNAERIAISISDPATVLKQASAWSDDARARDAITLALERTARRDNDAAVAAWPALSTQFHFDTDQRGRILRAIALHGATSYAPEAVARLAALPPDMADDITREWRVRTSLAKSDFKATLAALDTMPESQKSDARWRYLHARMLVKLGRQDAATAELSTLAREANFYGFLAADWLAQPYTICNVDPTLNRVIEETLRTQSNLSRAFEFFALNRLAEARREWDFSQSSLSVEQRRDAIALATKIGWYDRAVYAFSEGDEIHFYDLRFPLARRDQIERDSREAGIDPAFAYAIIRAESAWTTDAHSHADAYGLMQLLPGTASQLAKAAKMTYGGAHDLFDPDVNILLGTRYLGNMATRYDGSPWLASAAYNAGTDPVERWITQRETLEPDFFIETIPYKETREYVSRVLAFSVVYDWRLHGSALPLSARLPRIGQAYTPREDAVRKAVTCAAAAKSDP